MGGRYSGAQLRRQQPEIGLSETISGKMAHAKSAHAEAAMNWRDDLYRTWVAASITWAFALNLMIAIEKPDWGAVLGSETYWLFLVVPPLGMACLILGIVWIITRFPRPPK
jgi:hypothetical protein